MLLTNSKLKKKKSSNQETNREVKKRRRKRERERIFLFAIVFTENRIEGGRLNPGWKLRNIFNIVDHGPVYLFIAERRTIVEKPRNVNVPFFLLPSPLFFLLPPPVHDTNCNGWLLVAPAFAIIVSQWNLSRVVKVFLKARRRRTLSSYSFFIFITANSRNFSN